MQPNNLFLKFLQELFTRFAKKSPKFFQIWQWLLTGVTALTGLPAFLTGLGINLPPAALAFENKYVAYASIGALFMSMLTAQSTINSISPQGVANKQTDPKKLPFTAVEEVKAAVKQGKPTEVDPNPKPTVTETPKQ